MSWHLFASEHPELQHTAAHAQALCAHCSHPHRRAARRGGRSLPVTARKPMGWVGSAASPPSCSTRTRCTQPEHPKCRLRSPAILFSSLPRHAVLAAEQPLRCSCSPSLFSAPVLLLSEPNRQPAPWPSAAAAPCPGPACRMVAPASSPRPWGQTGEALSFLPPPAGKMGCMCSVIVTRGGKRGCPSVLVHPEDETPWQVFLSCFWAREMGSIPTSVLFRTHCPGPGTPAHP